MTRFNPCIIVNRVVIHRGEVTVYDERYHPGVNVIRGDNSSGKSTILNFIFYGLGGDLTDWSEAALQCTKVSIEVLLNGMPATLVREISPDRGQPMDVYGGTYESSAAAPIGQWLRYPYSRSGSRESFSQAIFRLLGLPEVAAEASGNVTIHQILRLLYADQLSPVESLFKFERFDPPNLRDAVGRLLCGAYDADLYSNELEIRSLSKERETVVTELKSLVAIIGEAEQTVTLEWAYEQEKNLQLERDKLQSDLESAEAESFSSEKHHATSLEMQNAAYAEVRDLQERIVALKSEQDSTTLEISDSADFIGSLESKLEALADISAVAQHLGEVSFESCPACYAPVKQIDDAAATRCPLCKNPYSAIRANERIAAIISDTALQIRQSRHLQRRRVERVDRVARELRTTEEQWRSASRRLDELRRLPSTKVAAQVRALQRRVGYLDRQLEDLKEKSRLVVLFNKKLERRSALDERISRLLALNETMRKGQELRLKTAYTLISDEIRWMLRNDLRRQDSFEQAESIEFDFSANHISVDGKTYFSASSRVVLKSSFFVAFLASAAKHTFFRHPRFCIIDTIEDKGMEPVRSHNFQELIARVSAGLDADHQIIYATAMIAPALDHDKYTVGRYSTRDEPSLKFEGIRQS